MALTVATMKAALLLRIGDGEPVEIGTIDIPIEFTLTPNTPTPPTITGKLTR